MSKEFTTVDGDDLGLDRSAINKHDQIQLVQQHPDSSPVVTTPQDSTERKGLRNSISEKRHVAASKLRQKLHINSAKDIEDPDPDSLLANATDEKSDSRLGQAAPTPDKTTFKDAMHNPVETVKSKVSGQGNHQIASNIAAKEVPHGKDVDLIKAKDAVKLARTDAEKAKAAKTVEELIIERQNMYVRWTLDRHVTNVRVLPRDSFVRKPRAAFEKVNAQGDIVMDWNAYAHHLLKYFAQQYGGQYIGYGSNPPPPSKDTIMPNIERLIVATAPFQEFIMTTRRVYRWENRAETTKYLIAYVVLWYLNLLLPGILSAIIYLVANRHFHDVTLEDLRQDVKRTEDVHQTALTLTEFIEKRGDELWADELLEGLGPWLMVQLCDLAAFFEVLRNFYEWRKPSRTLATLAVFVIGVVATCFTPLWLLVKLGTLSAGFTFFALFPISSNFPEYRLLASPAKRIFWNIPTHPQWAIQAIQAEGSRYQEQHASPDVKSFSKVDSAHPSSLPPMSPTDSAITGAPSNASEEAHGTYTAHYAGTKGRLIISKSAIRFEAKPGAVALWTLPYDQIQNLEKINRIVKQNVPSPKTDSGKDLKLVSKTGDEWVITNVDSRDQAFSQVLGFSDAVWQVVW